MFAWNNSVMPPNEAPKSPLAVRVKTPPTVEMIDHTQNEEEGDRNEAEKSEAEAENKTAESAEFAVKKQKTSDSSEEEKDLNQEDVTNDENKAEVQDTKAETETKLEPEIADYDNPLLVHVSNSFFKSETFISGTYYLL